MKRNVKRVEGVSNFVEDRFCHLLDAIDSHGKSEGPDVEVGDLRKFLELAFDSMDLDQKKEFVTKFTVIEFIEFIKKET